MAFGSESGYATAYISRTASGDKSQSEKLHRHTEANVHWTISPHSMIF